MHRTLTSLASFAAIALFAVGCATEAPTTPATGDQAGKTIVRHRDIVLPSVDCCGNVILFEGTLNYHIFRTYDAAGGYHFNINTALAGFKGTMPDGSQIVYTGPQHTNLNAPASGGWIETASWRYNYRVQGGDADCSGRFVIAVHVTITPDGDVVVDDVRITNVCD